jgi:NAD dependent epimerase/dehydratase family enzyme
MEFLLTADLSGPVNVGAPEPARVESLMAALAAGFGKPAKFRVPEFVLTAALGQMARELLLASARMVPAALTSAGFSFEHPTPESVARWVAGKL